MNLELLRTKKKKSETEKHEKEEKIQNAKCVAFNHRDGFIGRHLCKTKLHLAEQHTTIHKIARVQIEYV